MQATESDIQYHHGHSDPTDYQVDDLLLCIASRDGLRAGELYQAHEVARRRVGHYAITVVTIAANGTLVAIRDPEQVLVRTQLLVELRTPSGARTHSFPDRAHFQVWRAMAEIPPAAIYDPRHVPAERVPADARFGALCVPDPAPRTGLAWYVHDLVERTSDPAGRDATGQGRAILAAQESNRLWRRERR